MPFSRFLATQGPRPSITGPDGRMRARISHSEQRREHLSHTRSATGGRTVGFKWAESMVGAMMWLYPV